MYKALIVVVAGIAMALVAGTVVSAAVTSNDNNTSTSAGRIPRQL